MGSWTSKGITARRLAEMTRRLSAPDLLAKEIAPAFFASFFKASTFVSPGVTPIVAPDAADALQDVTTTAEIFLRFLPVKKRATSTNPFVGIGRLGGNDICIPDATVSKFHAFLLEGVDGSFSLIDAGSANGTFLERKLVPRRGGAPMVLRSGDTVRFGLAVATFLSAADTIAFLHDNLG